MSQSKDEETDWCETSDEESPLTPAIIRELYIEPLELTVTQAATGLGVSRKTLSMLLNSHAGDFAIDLKQC